MQAAATPLTALPKVLSLSDLRLKRQHTLTLAMSSDRFLIGTSNLAQVEWGKASVHASLALDGQNQICLQVLSQDPPVYIDGHLCRLGETHTVVDAVTLVCGNDRLLITLTEVSANPRSTQHLQQESVDALKEHISRELLAELDRRQMHNLGLSKDIDLVKRILNNLISSVQDRLPAEIDRTQFASDLRHEILGLGPLEILLSDAAITEIMVNRRDQIYVERAGRLELTNMRFTSDQTLLNVIERIVAAIGRRIDKSSPLVDARLSDGSRVNAVIPPLALAGPCLTIRKFAKIPITIAQLKQWGSLNNGMAALLEQLVLGRKNIVISGGTGSGKTTLLNVVSSFIPNDERIITIEDAAELQLQQQHVITLEARPANVEGKGAVTIRDLLKNTLRMRPDRILVGECRGGEAFDMLQAMNTGHDGSLTTGHANSPTDMLRRLETMVLMAGMELPLLAIRQQIASAVNIIVQQSRLADGHRKVTHICWISGLDGGEYVVRELVKRDISDGNVVVYGKTLEDFCRSNFAAGRYDYLLEQFALDTDVRLNKEVDSL